MALKNRLLPDIRRVSRLEHIVKGLLPAKPDRFKAPIRIHDSIWGEIELEPHEAALINTPLLQRLRRIKQLGSGHLVFPGATHTRFEHSLGVLEQASRMCDGLNEGRRGRAKLVTAEQRVNLRFAALCHDLGHGPFSHYSEMFYPQLPAHRKKGEPKNAEELSALIVTSEPFSDFCRAVGRMHGVRLSPQFIAAAITGDLPARQKYLGEIIHGPFDADKIDYLMRDGLYCGMPIKIDTQQIHRSLTTFNDRHKVRLAGKPRAAAALIQLVHHRQHMFAVVYRHHVARIFKLMFLNALRYARKEGASIGKWDLDTAVGFLTLDDEALLAQDAVASAAARDLLGRLRDRRMFKRALEISTRRSNKKTMRRIKTEDGVKLAEEIAAKAGVPPHLVALDPVTSRSYKEAHEMRIIQDEEPRKLGDLMSVKRDGDLLRGFLERPLLCCPKEHVKKVQEAARKHFGLKPTREFEDRSRPVKANKTKSA